MGLEPGALVMCTGWAAGGTQQAGEMAEMGEYFLDAESAQAHA